MNRLLPVALLLFICLCIVLILALPGTFWGLILKGFFGMCVLVLFKVAYNKMVLPGTCISAVFFTLAWWYAPSWPMYLFLVLMTHGRIRMTSPCTLLILVMPPIRLREGSGGSSKPIPPSVNSAC